MQANYSALILAGGRGERFWPWSRPDRPKQLLPLAGKKSLLEITLDRVSRLVAPERIWVLTGKRLLPAVRDLVGDRAQIVAEPIGRNTAPAVGLGAMLSLSQGDADAMVVLPADHLIPETELFQESVSRALELAQREPRLVTFGIPPVRPDTAYGYIERGDPISASEIAFEVNSFREKPDEKTAEEFVSSGNFFWNSGMFFWRPEILLEAIREHRPAITDRLGLLEGRLASENRQAALDEIFPEVEAISIDYAVMEKAANVAMIEASFEWDDLGSWKAWARRQKRDSAGNVSAGKNIIIDSEDCIVVGDDAPIAILGVKGLAVVQKNGSTLVCPIERSEEIRKIVTEMEKRGWES